MQVPNSLPDVPVLQNVRFHYITDGTAAISPAVLGLRTRARLARHKDDISDKP